MAVDYLWNNHGVCVGHAWQSMTGITLPPGLLDVPGLPSAVQRLHNARSCHGTASGDDSRACAPRWHEWECTVVRLTLMSGYSFLRSFVPACSTYIERGTGRCCCRTGTLRLSLLAAITGAVLIACTLTTKTLPRRSPPLVLSDPTSTSSDPVSLTVGTNRWSPSATVLEEAFFPLAVTMHNTGERPLCGGAPTAALHAPDGSASAAVLPTSVITQLFGPVAAVEQGFHQQTANPGGSNTGVRLLLVYGSHGGYAQGGGMQSGMGGGHRFSPLPYTSPFSSPYYSPFSSPYYSPYSTPYYSPFSSPFAPYALSPYSPFASPFSRYAPYEYGSALPPLPPNVQEPEAAPGQTTHSLITDIVTAAFASRPLAPHETRTGFLFFPRPTARGTPFTLTWSWYDCVTQQPIAHLSVPVNRPGR